MRNLEMDDGLSKREHEVLSWLQLGLSNKENALALGISPRTVQKHLQRVPESLVEKSLMMMTVGRDEEVPASDHSECQPFGRGGA